MTSVLDWFLGRNRPAPVQIPPRPQTPNAPYYAPNDRTAPPPKFAENDPRNPAYTVAPARPQEVVVQPPGFEDRGFRMDPSRWASGNLPKVDIPLPEMPPLDPELTPPRKPAVAIPPRPAAAPAPAPAAAPAAPAPQPGFNLVSDRDIVMNNMTRAQANELDQARAAAQRIQGADAQQWGNGVVGDGLTKSADEWYRQRGWASNNSGGEWAERAKGLLG